VSAQRQRVELTRVLESASAQGDLGHFQEAQRIIDVAESSMRNTKYKTKMHSACCDELTDARERFQSRREWESGGRAELRDATQMHKMQRVTNICSSSKSAKSSKSMYCSEVQGLWIQRSVAPPSVAMAPAMVTPPTSVAMPPISVLTPVPSAASSDDDAF